MPPPIVLWSRFPPPSGGVTESASRLRDELIARTDLAGVVDLDALRTVPDGLTRHARHLFWCSIPQKAWQHAAIAQVLGGERMLFVHGGDVDDEPRRLRLPRPFDRVIVTNELLRRDVEQRRLGRSVVLGSAWTPPTGATPRVRPPGGTRCVMAVGPNSRWYGLDLALDAVARIREARPDATLTVLGPVPRTASAPLPAWVAADGPVAALDVPATLVEHDILLRPSTTDGDSLVVRDALHLGLRVVASDVVPRPAGTELAPLTVDGFVRAVLDGGDVASGDGLGPPVLSLL